MGFKGRLRRIGYVQGVEFWWVMCTRIGDLLCMRAKDQKLGAKCPFFVPIFVFFGWLLYRDFLC